MCIKDSIYSYILRKKSFFILFKVFICQRELFMKELLGVLEEVTVRIRPKGSLNNGGYFAPKF